MNRIKGPPEQANSQSMSSRVRRGGRGDLMRLLRRFASRNGIRLLPNLTGSFDNKFCGGQFF